jgi:hypothetical protein
MMDIYANEKPNGRPGSVLYERKCKIATARLWIWWEVKSALNNATIDECGIK